MRVTDIQNLESIYLYSKKKKIYKAGNKLFVNDIERSLTAEEAAKNEPIDSIGRFEAREYYKEYLRKLHFSNLVILSGAGTSVKIGSSNKNAGGYTMANLWDALNSTGLVDLDKSDKEFGSFCKDSGYDEKYEDGTIVKDLEKLLDFSTRKAYSNSALNNLIEIVKKFILISCTLDIGKDETHKIFLRKITKRKIKDSRVKLFTTNYDTLWEQAAAQDRFTIIDGFTYSYPRFFNGRFFDFDIVYRERSRLKEEDSFVPKLFHLYKIHGSIGWKVVNNEIIQEAIELSDNEKKIDNVEISDRLLIFPSNNKYESSYEPPYFEMMSRFQHSLRKENTLLITIGFSFLDKHISNVIEETLKQNPSLILIVVDPSVFPERTNWKKVFSFADVDNRTILISERFADFSENYPDNDSFDQMDYMVEFTNKLTQLINGKP